MQVYSVCANTSSKLESLMVLSIHQAQKSLIGGINRQLQLNKAPFSLFDRANVQCRDLCNTLDVVRSDLHRDGIGADKNSAPVIAVEKVLGNGNPGI